MSRPPTLSATAYTLALLHAAAYPSNTVLGLLLGSPAAIDDALPLVHRYASLSFTASLGLDMARAAGKTVVGVYVASEGGLEREGEALLKAIRAQCPGAVGLVLDNARLAAGQPAFVLSTGEEVPTDAGVVAGALRLVREDGVQASIRDLDDHLDDARVDWIANETARAAARKL